jgi:serine protease Do
LVEVQAEDSRHAAARGRDNQSSMREAQMLVGQCFAPRASRNTLGAALLAALAALPLTLTPALAQTQPQNGDKNVTAQVQRQLPVALPSLAPLVERVSPAVVNISSQIGGEAAARQESSSDDTDQPGGGSPFEDLLRRFFENRGMPNTGREGTPNTGREAMALGSGFIIDPAGYIVTNNHVVGNATKITVILQDNSRHPAKVIGRDEKTDLALIKIEAKQKLPFVTWGDSDQAKVGDWVAAVGNPFGLGGTVTAGIISAVGRNIHEGPYDDYLQIDAPINRGNSGGPTFNLGAEVIGVNTAIYSPSGGSVGIGFAVPSNSAKSIVAQLKEKGSVTRGWLGVAIQGITPTIAKSLGLDPDQPRGALVASVTPNSPAAKAGIKQGDVVLAAGGRPIKNVSELPRIVAATQPGQKLDLTILRNGKEETVAATVAEMPEKPKQVAAAPSSDADHADGLGLQLAALSPALRRQYRIPNDVDGVVVTKLAGDSPAAALGMEAGDVIVSIDQQPAKTPQQAADALKEASAKGNVLLLINRRGTSQFVGLTVTPGLGSSTPR